MAAKGEDFKIDEGVRWANKQWEALHRDMTAPTTTTEDISAALSALGLEGAGGAEELKKLFAAGGTKLAHATGARVKSALGTLQGRAKAAAKAKAEAEVAGGAGEEAQVAAAALTKTIVDILGSVDLCREYVGLPSLSPEATAEGATPPFTAEESATKDSIHTAIARRITGGSKFSVGGLEAPAGARSQAEACGLARSLVKALIGGPALETEAQLATAGPGALFASCSAGLKDTLAGMWAQGHALIHDASPEDARKHVAAVITAAATNATVNTIKAAALSQPPSRAESLIEIQAASLISLNEAVAAMLSGVRHQRGEEKGSETAKNVTASAALNGLLKDCAARGGGWPSLQEQRKVYTVESCAVGAPRAAAAVSLAVGTGIAYPLSHLHPDLPDDTPYISIAAAKHLKAGQVLSLMSRGSEVEVVGEDVIVVTGLEHTALHARTQHLLYHDAVPTSSAQFRGAVNRWLMEAATGDTLAREACGGTGSFPGPQTGLAEWAFSKLDAVACELSGHEGTYSSVTRVYDHRINVAPSYHHALTFLFEGVALAGTAFVHATASLGALYTARAARDSGKGAFGAGPPRAAPQHPGPPAGGGGGEGGGGGSSGREVPTARKPPPAKAYPDGYVAPAILLHELKDQDARMQTAEDKCWQCGVEACSTKHNCNSRRGSKVFPLRGAKTVVAVINHMYSAIARHKSA